MFIQKPQNENSELDRLITEALSQLDAYPAASTEYAEILNQVDKLYALKNISKPLPRVSPDTMAIVLGNLAGIVIIVGHERANVVTSKALNFILKASR